MARSSSLCVLFFISVFQICRASRFEVSQIFKECEKEFWDGNDIKKIVVECLHLPEVAENCLLTGITPSMSGDALLQLSLNCVPDVSDKECLTKIYTIYHQENDFYAKKQALSQHFTEPMTQKLENAEKDFHAALEAGTKTPKQLAAELNLPQNYFDLIANFIKTSNDAKPLLVRCRESFSAQSDPASEVADAKVIFLLQVYDKRTDTSGATRSMAQLLWIVPFMLLIGTI